MIGWRSCNVTVVGWLVLLYVTAHLWLQVAMVSVSLEAVAGGSGGKLLGPSSRLGDKERGGDLGGSLVYFSSLLLL